MELIRSLKREIKDSLLEKGVPRWVFGSYLRGDADLAIDIAVSKYGKCKLVLRSYDVSGQMDGRIFNGSSGLNLIKRVIGFGTGGRTVVETVGRQSNGHIADEWLKELMWIDLVEILTLLDRIGIELPKSLKSKMYGV